MNTPPRVARNLVRALLIVPLLSLPLYLFSSGGRAGNATSAAPTDTETATTSPTADAAPPAPTEPDCKTAPRFPLPLPSKLGQAAFQNYDVTLYNFLACGNYLRLGWAHDKGVRDTGPYINGAYYGTHPAVRIFYSPRVLAWLKAGRKGDIPDGEMIIKEQYSPPAARYQGMSDAQLETAFANSGKDWTVMIRDAKGSKDGWYWAEVFTGMKPDAQYAYKAPFNYPNGGFGHYCLNCHSSAEKAHTFSALNNIVGFPGDPLTFRVDNSWRTPPHAARMLKIQGHHKTAVAADATPTVTQLAAAAVRSEPVPISKVQMMVPETFDRIVAGHKGPQEFLSSDQCLGCHSAISGANPTMFLSTVPLPSPGVGINVSPYGEWRWSPMGLAGRDPVFYAQLESELAYIDSLPDKKTAQSLRDTTVNTCFRCHGVMGKRQWDIDHRCDPTDPVKPCNPAEPGRPQFKETFPQIADSANPHFKYGALARDGVSCLACHRQQPMKQPAGKQENPLKYFLEHGITGLFQTGPADKIFGPFDDVVTLPMDHALGIKPEQSKYIKSSRMCGACHAINLPIIDRPPIAPVGSKTHYNMEQSTYLEWLNSKYQDEIAPIAACRKTTGNGTAPAGEACAQSCQNCHMPGGYQNPANKLDVKQIATQIAVIEDQNSPAADARAPTKDINVRYRETGFARHELLGMNVFLLEMAKQFNEVLGLRISDYMSGSTTGIEQTIDNFVRQAQTRTARIEARLAPTPAGKLAVELKVANLAGHRLPSGVGFRRAFVEFVVLDTSVSPPKVVWGSGRTNAQGVIVDGQGKPLPSEFFEEYTDPAGKKRQHFQPHYQVITAENQVQIYEELTRDANGQITTSFLRRDDEFKDNRLLPVGWTRTGPDPKNFSGEFLEATFPKGDAARDPDYLDGSGTDRLRYEIALPAGTDPKNLKVRATLYYQSIPPYFLAQRFRDAPNGPATQRLRYLTTNLKLDGSPAKDWKLAVASTELSAKP